MRAEPTEFADPAGHPASRTKCLAAPSRVEPRKHPGRDGESFQMEQRGHSYLLQPKLDWTPGAPASVPANGRHLLHPQSTLPAEEDWVPPAKNPFSNY